MTIKAGLCYTTDPINITCKLNVNCFTQNPWCMQKPGNTYINSWTRLNHNPQLKTNQGFFVTH